MIEFENELNTLNIDRQKKDNILVNKLDNKIVSKNCAPIGIFDSGLGGLSVLKTMMQLLPKERFIYYGDSARAPYGPREKAVVESFSDEIVQFLIDRGCKAIVIACNTATSAAAPYLRNKFDMPIVGMEPALKPAAIEHPGGRIAVLATEMTLKEQKFAKLMLEVGQNNEIEKLPVPEFVSLVERGILSGSEVNTVLERLFPLNDNSNLEGIVLGCTHYVFLKPAINDYFNNQVQIYDGNLGTVEQLQRVLKMRSALCLETEGDLLSTDRVTIYNSAGPDMVKRSYDLLFSGEI